MSDLHLRFHGLPPLKRFKMLQKESESPLPPHRSPMVQVRSLPAKKRVCALDFIHLVSEDDGLRFDKENKPDRDNGLGSFLHPPPQCAADSDPSPKPSKAGHGNGQVLAPLKTNLQIHPIERRKSGENYARVVAAGKVMREATKNITPPKKRARLLKENSMLKVTSQERVCKPSFEGIKECKEDMASCKDVRKGAEAITKCPKGKNENSADAEACTRRKNDNSKKKGGLETKADPVHRTEGQISSCKKNADGHQPGNAKATHQKIKQKDFLGTKHSYRKGDRDHSQKRINQYKGSELDAAASCQTKLQKSCSSAENPRNLSDAAKKILPEELEGSPCVPPNRNADKSIPVSSAGECHNRCDKECPLYHPSRLEAGDERVHSAGKEKNQEEEEEEDGVLCDVCREADADETDPIVFCDGCDVMVHASCYGSPLIEGVPEGDWYCDQCKGRERKEGMKECCLCPKKGGAMKETTEGGWAHLSCALFVPEVYYRKAREREGIECGKVPAWRWKLPCVLCSASKGGRGACIQCTEVGCTATFHVSCAMDAGLSLDIRSANSFTPAIVIAFCPSHSDQALSSSERRRFKIVPRD